ncbi:MAG: DUF3991 domain-containing protein [Defluviitaleaceae bacterium]|nr:DUF3991 domain-containing protein [Defluviitaleaceae bacterium]
MIEQRFVEQARNADMIDFLHRHYGYSFSASHRCRQHPSLAVKNDRRSWFWHSKGIGGYGAIDFLMKIEQREFGESVEAITGIGPIVVRSVPEESPPKKLILPEKSKSTKRLYDYLCVKRGIDRGIVEELLDSGKIYQDERGNVVFVGHDEQGKARFASLRGTSGSFRIDCTGSDKRYGFNMVASSPSEWLYFFESAIDAMSHASLANAETSDKTAWLRHSRLSLSGTADTAIPFFLQQHKAVKGLVFCLDNDAAGHNAATTMVLKYSDKGYQTRIKSPRGKDFNEDLLAFATIGY